MPSSLALDSMPVATGRALFDVTRLIARRRRSFGTGVDRIDLAVGLGLLDRFGEDCGFVCATPSGPALLSHGFGEALLRALAARWGGATADRPPRAAPALMRGVLRGVLRGCATRSAEDTTYVVASHGGLPLRRGALRRLDPDRRMPCLAYVHDLIPLEFPEYQGPSATAAFRRFLAEIAEGPASYAANTFDTARRLVARAIAEGRAPPSVTVRTPRLTPDPAPPRPGPKVRAALAASAPFLLCIGTIEPRKNHLLLLNLWRALGAEGRAPRLLLVGRRGWENEMVVDMLERCPAVRAHVTELGDLSDPDVWALLRATRALLMPSFAEGLGIPLLEAAAAGAPAIVSDLPALREIAPPGTRFLDPLDGPAWREAILAAAG